MTHNERVLQLLSDGKPHSHHELYALNVVGHSRISDLRRKGHVIDHWREGDLYWYALREPAAVPPSGGVAAAGSRSADAQIAASAAAAEVGAVPLQLSLQEVSA